MKWSHADHSYVDDLDDGRNGALPDAFLNHFRALELERWGARGPLPVGHASGTYLPPGDYNAAMPAPEHAMLLPEVAQHHFATGWWICVRVIRPGQTGGRTWAVLGRPFTDDDLRRAAEELFENVYGPANGRAP